MSKRKVLVRGPALSNTGYGKYCRTVLKMLDNDANDLHLINVTWGSSGWISEDDSERARIDELIMKTAKAVRQEQESVSFDISFQVQNPDEWQKLCPVNVGVSTSLITDKLPEEWAQGVALVDKVIVPSEFAKNVYNSDNVEVIGLPITEGLIQEQLDLGLTTKFNFLNISQVSPRKNVEAIVTAFIKEFREDSDAGLVLKLNVKNNSRIDREYVLSNLSQLCQQLDQEGERSCKIYLLHGSMTKDEINSLYSDSSIKSYVNASLSENLGFCLLEAASNGLPIVSPYYSAIRDISSESNITSVEYDELNIDENATDDSKHCLIKVPSLRRTMRSVYENYEDVKNKSEELKNLVNENNSEQNVKTRYNNIINNLMENKDETK